MCLVQIIAQLLTTLHKVVVEFFKNLSKYIRICHFQARKILKFPDTGSLQTPLLCQMLRLKFCDGPLGTATSSCIRSTTHLHDV